MRTETAIGFRAFCELCSNFLFYVRGVSSYTVLQILPLWISVKPPQSAAWLLNIYFQRVFCRHLPTPLLPTLFFLWNSGRSIDLFPKYLPR